MLLGEIGEMLYRNKVMVMYVYNDTHDGSYGRLKKYKNYKYSWAITTDNNIAWIKIISNPNSPHIIHL
jgi:hypothetical protein